MIQLQDMAELVRDRREQIDAVTAWSRRPTESTEKKRCQERMALSILK